jgi:hypothetical protein
LNERVAERGSDVLVAALEDIRSGDVGLDPIDAEEGSYYSMPSRDDVREFRRKGNAFY